LPARRRRLRTGAGTVAAGGGPDGTLLPSADRLPGMTATPIIELRGVSKRFGPTYDAAARLARALSRRFGAVPKNEVVQAVDRVDFAVARGEVVGLVGESG